MRSQTGADYLVAEFANAGIQMAFGFPGESTLSLYAAFKNAPMRHVMARCERCAGYMADVYARLTRRVAVCDAPGGIGSPHLLPALHEAYNSSIPIVILTTTTPDASTYRWTTDHCRHEDIFAPVVKEVLRVQTGERIGELAKRAVNIAVSGRPGPVHLDIALNLLATPAVPSLQVTGDAHASFPRFRPRPDDASLVEVVSLLKKAGKPLIVAGGGVLLSGAEAALERFATTFQIPVATTLNGKGSLSEIHPLSVGVIGSKGCDVANQIATEADVVLWLGSKAGDKSTNFGRIPSTTSVVIQVDIDPHEHGRTLNPSVSLCADITATLDDLYTHLTEHEFPSSLRWCSYTSRLVTAFRTSVQRQAEEVEFFNTAVLISQLQQRYAHEAVIVADASRACSWVGAFYNTAYAGRIVIAPRGSGSIGYALPGTIAAAVTCPDRTVIGIGGDGGFAMACHELETAVRLQLRFIFVILNNNSLGLLNQVAGVSMNDQKLLSEFAPTDWEMVARGFGCDSQTITSFGELSRALDHLTTISRPTVLNVILPATEESPDFKMFVSRNVIQAD